jgi:hypothetical protein
MPAPSPTAIHPLKPHPLDPTVSPHIPNGSKSSIDPQRLHLLDKAAELDRRACSAAERGELQTSARFILESLDCERRAGGLGPQVLQLIKPRS